jgi:class 3 adenylate cyclase/tetratricopeptide (TPR) repeat protein
VQVCPGCGEENPDRFRLCGICGTKLQPDVPVEDVRKTVTVVYSDLKGSTTLGEQLDTESVREVLNVYFREMKAVLERHGGTVEKFIGDAVMAVFGLPRLHEDDALRAVRAAAEMQSTLQRVNDQLEARWGVRLENRTGVNTGEVVAGDATPGQRLVTGDTVNTAARLEQAAPTLEVLIGEPTYRLVKDAVKVEAVEPLSLKGKAEPVPAYRLIAVTSDEGLARRMDAPMIGRQDEMAVLGGALDRAVGRKGGELVTVLGPAGVGKSRLLAEFLSQESGRAVALRGRCLSYGEGVTFFPLGEIVREVAGIAEDDSLEAAGAKLAAVVGPEAPDVADRMAATIGLSPTAYPVEETFWAARRFLELIALRSPLIVVIDDIHWAEETFLDLLRHVADAAEAAVVVLCSARPDLLEEHPEWAEDRANARAVTLQPLSAEQSSMVLESLLGPGTFPEAARDRIIQAAEGNPLFVQQMLSMLIDDGSLVRDGPGWTLTTDLASLQIPPSISALLSARLDRLGATDRTVVERAAVIGQVFWQEAVEALVPGEVEPVVVRSLETLTRKELIGPHESMVGEHEAYRFLHILIRDAAYHGLLKRARADLHARFVEWLERVSPDRVTEYAEIRGYHLEQAYLILVQLGPVDEAARELGSRGAGYLSSAGRRALARGDMPAAANLLQRAAALLPPDDPTRPRLFIEAGEALVELGDFVVAGSLLETAIEEAPGLSDEALETTARIVRTQLDYTTRPGEMSEAEVIGLVERAIPVLEAEGSHDGVARAWRLLTFVHWTALRYSAAEVAARKTMEHARLAGDHLMETRFLTSLGMCALYGPMPVKQAIGRCKELLDRAANDRKAEAVLLCVLARLEAMEGRFDSARQLYRRSRAQLEEFGWNLYAALTSLDSGPVELLAGDAAAAEAELRRDYQALEQMGERNYIATTAGFLAEALYAQGRYDESSTFARTSSEVSAEDDVAAQFHWRSVTAKLLARAGRLEEAEAMAREALDIILRSEEVDSQAGALLDLGEVLRLAGKAAQAVAAIEEGAELYERKGNLVFAAKARSLLESLRMASPAEAGSTGERPPG